MCTRTIAISAMSPVQINVRKKNYHRQRWPSFTFKRCIGKEEKKKARTTTATTTMNVMEKTTTISLATVNNVCRKERAIKKFINIPFKSVHVLYVLLNAHIIQYQSSFYSFASLRYCLKRRLSFAVSIGETQTKPVDSLSIFAL